MFVAVYSEIALEVYGPERLGTCHVVSDRLRGVNVGDGKDSLYRPIYLP